MTRRLDYRWHLRQVMAGRGMFATTDLIGPLAEREIRLSSSQVYRLVAERPERLSLKVLMALLDILDCSLEDLIEPVPRPARREPGRRRQPAPRPASAGSGPGGPASTGRGDRGHRASRPGRVGPGRADHRPGHGSRARARTRAGPGGGRRRRRRARQVTPACPRPGRAARSARRRQVPGAPGHRETCSSPCMTRAPGTPRCRPARSAAGRSGASSDAARTGTARPARGTTSRAPPAARTGPSPPGTGQAGPGARSARTTTAVTRSPSSTASSPPWIPAPGGKPSPSAVRRSAPGPHTSRNWHGRWKSNPALLTGDGHLAPLRAIPRFIEMLDDAGIAGVVRPACGRCGRVVRIDKPLDGVRVCRSCIAQSRAEPCARCGAVREPVTRDGQGRPVCANCFITDPENLETCTGCGRVRRVDRRTADGPLCSRCPSLPVLACSVCGQTAPCGISRATGKPWCPSCQRRRAACSACGRHEAIASGTLRQPALRRLHPAAALGRLPRLQRPGSSQPRPVRPLPHQRPAGRADGP